jgi:hypothetical protein
MVHRRGSRAEAGQHRRAGWGGRGSRDCGPGSRTAPAQPAPLVPPLVHQYDRMKILTKDPAPVVKKVRLRGDPVGRRGGRADPRRRDRNREPARPRIAVRPGRAGPDPDRLRWRAVRLHPLKPPWPTRRRPAPCRSRRTGWPSCPLLAWRQRRSWSAPPAAPGLTARGRPRSVRPENNGADPAGTEPAQPPWSSIESMLRVCDHAGRPPGRRRAPAPGPPFPGRAGADKFGTMKAMSVIPGRDGSELTAGLPDPPGRGRIRPRGAGRGRPGLAGRADKPPGPAVIMATRVYSRPG